MYTMKEVCKETGMTYEGLKFYCNQGLIPYVKRDKNNRRVFDEHDLAWIKSLVCLKNCDMTIVEMKEYLKMCMAGKDSIPERKIMLTRKQEALKEKLASVQEAISYIDWKQQFYNDVQSGKIEYYSNLVPPVTDDKETA